MLVPEINYYTTAQESCLNHFYTPDFQPLEYLIWCMWRQWKHHQSINMKHIPVCFLCSFHMVHAVIHSWLRPDFHPQIETINDCLQTSSALLVQMVQSVRALQWFSPCLSYQEKFKMTWSHAARQLESSFSPHAALPWQETVSTLLCIMHSLKLHPALVHGGSWALSLLLKV